MHAGQRIDGGSRAASWTMWGRGVATSDGLSLSLVVLLFLAAALVARPGMAGAAEASDPHAHHRHLSLEHTRSMAAYTIPDVKLVRDDGREVKLADELNDGRPVVLNFIYTSCTSICPMTSLTFSELQGKLERAHESVHLVSISIDPEQDTPARLREYARRFSAGANWQHYTGTLGASLAAQRAFDVYRGDKMSHTPATLVRAAPGERWVRIDGFATASQLLDEVRAAGAAK